MELYGGSHHQPQGLWSYQRRSKVVLPLPPRLAEIAFLFKVRMKDDLLLNLTDFHFILSHFFLLCGLLILSIP